MGAHKVGLLVEVVAGGAVFGELLAANYELRPLVGATPFVSERAGLRLKKPVERDIQEQQRKKAS